MLLLALAGCGDGGGSDLGAVDLSVVDLQVLAGDSDADGLTDAEEAQLASDYLPFLSVSATDACSTSGLVVRVTPTTPAPLVALRYVWLFDRACDGVALAGDGGVFVVIADPRKPAPDGIVSMRAIARPDSTCQRLSTCGRCTGESPCSELGGAPAVWAGRDRHSIYVDRSVSCTQTPPCMVACEDAEGGTRPPIVEIGEPGAPRVHDLTDAGFIQPMLGWTSAGLMHYDPWGDAPFGALPPLRQLLTDKTADAPTCSIP
jgi:hypothetical protein